MRCRLPVPNIRALLSLLLLCAATLAACAPMAPPRAASPTATPAPRPYVAVVGGLNCCPQRQGYVALVDAATGTSVWRQELGDYGAFMPPLYADGQLYVFAGEDGVATNDSIPPQEILALDIHSGRTIWKLPTTAAISVEILVNGTLYITLTDATGAQTLLAIEAATGQIRWQDHQHGRIITVDNEMVYTEAFPTPLLSTFAALHAGDGVPMWTRTLTDVTGALGIMDGRVLIPEQPMSVGTYYGLLALDAATGETLWRVEDRGPARGLVEKSTVFADPVSGDAAYVVDSTGASKVRLTDGAVLWHLPITRFWYPPILTTLAVSHLWEDAGVLLALIAHVPNTASLDAYDAATGKLLWSMPGTILLAAHGRVFTLPADLLSDAAPTTLTARDIHTGATLWSTSMPPPTWTGLVGVSPVDYPYPGGPQLAVEANGQLYLWVQPSLAQPPFLLTLDPASGKTLWQYQPPRGVDAYTPLIAS